MVAVSPRICVFGLSGSGKSTFAGLVEQFCADEGLECQRVKLAEPLYRLQRAAYHVAGVQIGPEVQDQVLMRLLAEQLRRLNPRALADDFTRRIRTIGPGVAVVNDDLRDPHIDHPTVRALGFTLVRLVCSPRNRRLRLADRADLTIDTTEAAEAELDAIEPDLVVTNDGSLTDLQAEVETVMRRCLP